MDATHEKDAGARHAMQAFNPQAGRERPTAPVAARPCTEASAHRSTGPARTLRTPASPTAAQPRMPADAAKRMLPVVPPVYRPRPAHTVLLVSPTHRSLRGDVTRQPIVPETHRPELRGALKPGMAATAQARRLPTASTSTVGRFHRAIPAHRPAVDTSQWQNHVVQRAREIEQIFSFVDLNKAALKSVGGAEMRRLLYWNDKGFFDQSKGLPLNLKTVKKAMGNAIPEQVDASALPNWMQARTTFAINLPAFFGGGKLWIRKERRSVCFEGRGWISDNCYWRSPDGSKIRYMIHAILEWSGKVASVEEPTPHITLRNADTQAKIDLDAMSPLPDEATRIKSKLEATKSSYSQGLGVDREPGANMKQDEETFKYLTSKAVQDWLGKLANAAQAALLPELQEV